MPIIKVSVKPDHLQSLATAKKPIIALAELIWNALDANADNVSVKFQESKMGGIESIVVEDDGEGLPYAQAKEAFGNLGGSLKKMTPRATMECRMFHGRYGKGRFRAFALGNTIRWHIRFKDTDGIQEYSVVGNKSSLDSFEASEPRLSKDKTTGTQVTVSDLTKNWRLTGDAAHQEITEQFALYLRQYRSVQIVYGGREVQPEQLQKASEEYSLTVPYEHEGQEKHVVAQLTVIEWKHDVERALYLCDEDGFALECTTPGIQAPGLGFTAYLKSALIRDLASDGCLGFGEMHPALGALIEAAKDKLREHYRVRRTQMGVQTLESWKQRGVYPFQGKPKHIIETTERQVFDVFALNLNEFVPNFEDAGDKNLKLSLRLLKHAIETSPSSLRTVLQEILDLPKERQDELADLLRRTSLSAMITACKLVVGRLDFLKGLEVLLFEEEPRKQLLERRQLHRILATETWIFGEEFSLTNDDESLTEVLKKHLELLGKKGEVQVYEPVLTPDNGSGCIVDLVLSRRVPLPRREQRQHLVIELKRPLQPIDNDCLNQVKKYAQAVAEDDRFKGTDTRWVFWALSTKMTSGAKREASAPDRPPGLVQIYEDPNIEIWTKEWGQIIEEARARLAFFQENLEYAASRDDAVQYLRRTHEKYLPAALAST